MHGWAGKRLRLDFTKGDIIKEPLSYEYRRKWIGGRGFNSDIIYNEVPPEMSPFDPRTRVCLGAPAKGSPQRHWQNALLSSVFRTPYYPNEHIL